MSICVSFLFFSFLWRGTGEGYDGPIYVCLLSEVCFLFYDDSGHLLVPICVVVPMPLMMSVVPSLSLPL
jgi:hypothetical protein